MSETVAVATGVLRRHDRARRLPRRALAGRSRVTIKTYAALNHLFVPGEGRSVPQEYLQPGNVAEEVVRDIAAWIASVRA